MEAPNNKVVQITHWCNKAAVVTKNACKSICLGVQDTAGALIIMHDVINLTTPILHAY